MEIIEAQLSDLGPDFREFVVKSVGTVKGLIAKALSLPEVGLKEITVYGLKYDEMCLEEALSPYDVKNCDLDIMVVAKITEKHYFVVTSAHYTVMFRKDFRDISRDEVGMLGGEDAFMIVTDLYDRVVGSILFFGMYVFSKVCRRLAVGGVMNHIQKAEMLEKILAAYEGMDVIAVKLELE